MRFSFISVAFLVFIIAILSCSTVRSSSAQVIYSQHVKDSFELYIDLPDDYNRSKKYSVVFYMDANLKSGKELRRQIHLDSNRSKLSDVIFVGIGHIGNYRVLRRRDLIPPLVKENDIVESKDPNYGHADKFYLFLTKELIPFINKQYPNNGEYSYIGHSFGGLFGFYCFTKADQPFKNIIALSPSLWVNNNNIFPAEENFYNDISHKRDLVLYHSCGTGEWINKVLSTSRQMKNILNKRGYKQLRYIYHEFPGQDHNSSVAFALEDVLKRVDL